MSFIRFLGGSLLLSALSACGWLYGENGLIHDSRNDYVTAKKSNPIQVPAAYAAYQQQDMFEVPTITAKDGIVGDTLDVAPPALVLATAEGVHAIQDQALPAAILVGEANVLWQELTEFLQQTEITVVKQDENTHELTTDWVESERIGWFSRWVLWEDILGFRWQYRFHLQAGERPNEHQLSVEAVAMGNESRWDGWQELKPNRRHSTDMLNRFLGFHDDNMAYEARKRVLAARAGIKVELWEDAAGNTGLLAQAPIDMTWDATPAVFAGLGFELEDKDTTKRVYFLQLTDENMPGFWSSLFDWGGESDLIAEELDEGEYTVTLTEEGETTGMVISEANGDILKKEKMVKLFPALSAAFMERRPASMLERRRN